MKRVLDQSWDSSNTTAEVDSKPQVKDNSNLFNCIGKLAAEHYVHVSNTMIKVTYKKALKDQNASLNTFSPDIETVFTKSMNVHSELSKKKSRHVERTGLCNGHVSFIQAKKTRPETPAGKTFAYHCTPKKPQASAAAERKKNYANGLGFSPRSSLLDKQNSSGKERKGFSFGEGASSMKKSKPIPGKGTGKSEVKKRFLKGDGSEVRSKDSIIQRTSAEAKKTSLNKSCGKIKDKENGVKKKVYSDKKGRKRKASSTEVNVLTKKIKVSARKTKGEEGGGKLGDEYKCGNVRKPIMLVDPDLPTGWTRYIRTRNKGSANEQYVVYVVNPQGKKFRFKWKLRQYLAKTNSPLDVDRFFFGLYRRPKTSSGSAVEREEGEEQVESKGERSFAPRNKSVQRSEGENVCARNSRTDGRSRNQSRKSSDGRKLLLFDPDLPFGWRRVIHSNVSSGKKQVHIISPDGKIFRRRYRLNEYLVKHQYTHNPDRFYFGLYPKKEGNVSDISGRESVPPTPRPFKRHKQGDSMKAKEGEGVNENGRNESSSPMYNDPKLPAGWKRFIRIRSCGGSAGRMEVVIVSPDGRKHGSRKRLERYLLQKDSEYKAEDFDFHVFGKRGVKRGSDSLLKLKSESEREAGRKQEPDAGAHKLSFSKTEKKFTDKPVPELDIDSPKEIEMSHESRMIETVKGLMMSCGLSSARNVRRQRFPREVQEKQVKGQLRSEAEVSCDGCEIPKEWIERLVKCRGDLRSLEPDAASAIGEAAKEFIKKISFLALSVSKEPDKGLRYEDVAELVHKSESLSPLQILIPKKITYKEYLKLNRPKQFLSFT